MAQFPIFKKITFLRNDLYKIKCMLFYVILGGIGVQGPPGDVGPAGPKGEIGEPGGNEQPLNCWDSTCWGAIQNIDSDREMCHVLSDAGGNSVISHLLAEIQQLKARQANLEKGKTFSFEFFFF